ncbi:MAG TPA: hypothetical protein VK859_15170 [bacterium]|nr:hypothetical protein [bacterium]
MNQRDSTDKDEVPLANGLDYVLVDRDRDHWVVKFLIQVNGLP